MHIYKECLNRDKLYYLKNFCLQNLSHNDLRLRGAQMLGHVMTVTRYLSHLNLAGMLQAT